MTQLPSAPELIDRAQVATGLDDFGEGSWREPLDLLLDSLATEVRLLPRAVDQIADDLVRHLRGRLEYVDWWTAHPEELSMAVDGPTLVCGLPRTGTTALAGMLACDPASRSLRAWEANEPLPPPDLATEHDDPRVAAARAAKATLAEQASELMKMHLIDPLGPEEPHELVGATFRSQFFAGIYPVRSYGDWWSTCDMTPTFEYQRRAFQSLQFHRPPNRWVLKAPYYAAHLDDFDAVHPEARFVMTHRDPGQAVPSLCSLTASLLDGVSDSWDRVEHLAWLERSWVVMMDRAMDARDRLGEDRFLDVDHRDLVRDPMGEIGRIYDFLGWDLTPEAFTAIKDYTVENRSEKHGNHRYTAEQFGFTAAGIREDFQAYCDRFGV